MEAAEDGPIRWSGANPAPRLYLPVTADRPARVGIEVLALKARGLPELALGIGGAAVAHEVADRRIERNLGRARLVFETRLRPDRGTIVSLAMDPDALGGVGPPRKRGFAVGRMRFDPLD